MVRDKSTPKEISNHMGKADTGSTTRNNKTICLPFLQEVYNDTKTPISAIPDWSQNALK